MIKEVSSVVCLWEKVQFKKKKENVPYLQGFQIEHFEMLRIRNYGVNHGVMYQGSLAL